MERALRAVPEGSVDAPRTEWYQRRVPSSRSFRTEALSHAETLHRLAMRLSGSAAQADDLVQETYARALGGEASFQAGTNLRAWLCRILRNAFVDAHRKTRLETTSDDDAIVDPPDPGAELARLRQVTSADLRRALDALSPDARAIVLLDLEGFSEPELAEILGVAQGTVKSRLFRARAALRARLGDYAP
jgi:RNA polymerase sigma-70 factor (ECF subfamily)